MGYTQLQSLADSPPGIAFGRVELPPVGLFETTDGEASMPNKGNEGVGKTEDPIPVPSTGQDIDPKETEAA